MSSFFNSFITDKDEFAKDFYREYLISSTTEMFVQKIKEREASYEDIAKGMGKTKGFVSQILCGNRNMTLKTLSDLSYALGYRVNIGFESLPESFQSIDDLLENNYWQASDLDYTPELSIKSGGVIYKEDEKFWQKAA